MSDHKKIDWLRWHKRKYFIRINCFIMVCILLIVLLLQFPIVHAEGSGNVITMSGIADKPFCIPTNYCMGGAGYVDYVASQLDSNSTWQNNAVYGSSVSLDCSQYFTGSGLSYPNDDYKYYVVTTDGNYVWTNYIRSNYQCVWWNNRVVSTHTPPYEAEIYAYWYAGTLSNPNSNNSVSQNNDINGAGIYCLATNMMVISSRSGITESQINSNFSSLLQNGDLVNVNWNYLPNCDPFASEYGQPIDNTTRDHKKPYAGSTMYLKTSNLNNGAVNIVLKSDAVQKQNAKVVFRCSVASTVSHNATHTYELSAGNGKFADNYGVPDNNFSLGTYSEYEIPVSAFSNDGLYSIDLSTLNQGLWNSNEKSLYYFNQNFEDQSTYASYTITSAVFYLLTIGNATWDYSRLSNFDYNLLSEVYDCSASLVINGNEERFASFQYDMVSGSLTEQNYDLPDEDTVKTVLNVPTVPNDYVPTPQKPTYPDAYNITVPNTPSNNDNSDTNNNNVAPTNNNNVTNGDYSPSVVNNNNVTIEQGNKYPDKGVMQSFIRIINNDKNNAVNDVNTLVAGNDFINLCNNTLYAVPNQYWNVCLTALKAILGIGVSAFFLKILYNWAT